jgi:hypothetical protein
MKTVEKLDYGLWTEETQVKTYGGWLDSFTRRVTGDSRLGLEIHHLNQRAIDTGAYMSVPISVSTNGHDFADSTFYFTYHDILRIDSVWPSHGPLQGNTTVRINGTGFLPTAVCKFGRNRFLDRPPTLNHPNGIPRNNVTYISSTFIACKTPNALLPLPVMVEVSNNGGEQWSHSTAKFNFGRHPEVNKVWPPVGPCVGGTAVVVNGSFFVDSPELSCKFGRQVTPATFQSSSLIKCMAPPVVPCVTTATLNSSDCVNAEAAFAKAADLTVSDTFTPLGNQGLEIRFRTDRADFRENIVRDDIFQVPIRYLPTLPVRVDGTSVTESAVFKTDDSAMNTFANISVAGEMYTDGSKKLRIELFDGLYNRQVNTLNDGACRHE